jgi:hypothetical protein
VTCHFGLGGVSEIVQLPEPHLHVHAPDDLPDIQGVKVPC